MSPIATETSNDPAWRVLAWQPSFRGDLHERRELPNSVSKLPGFRNKTVVKIVAWWMA
jgi:hypothetical protein